MVQLPVAYLLRGPLGIDGVTWAVVAGWCTGLVYTVLATRRHLTVAEGQPARR